MPRPSWITALFLVAVTASSANALGTSRVASGLALPVYATAAPGDPRLFIIEQRGVIRILIGGQLRPTPFLDIDSLVVDPSQFDERGLLGLAFHPDFPESAFIFVDYVSNANKTVIARYPVSATNTDSVDTTKPRVILTIDQPYFNHKGGTLLFGPDRDLYIGMGDGGSGGDPENRAQDPTMLLGKMLRIDPIGGNPYRIPPDNPFLFDPTYRPEIWAIGLRNPYRWSFDRQTGDQWIADVGQNLWEEVDYEPAGKGGENYGWRRLEGLACYDPATGCDPDTFDLPIHVYDHSDNRCAITGGCVYRGSAMPAEQGAYFFGDYCSGQIWSLRYDGVTATVTERTTELGGAAGLGQAPVAIGQDAYGEMYIVDRGVGTDGEVWAVLPTGTGVGPMPQPALQLGPMKPNPFTSQVSFDVKLASPGNLEVSVMDTRGRQVATLASGPHDAGPYTLHWDGVAENGRRAPSGVYYVRVSLHDQAMTRTITLAR
jgi:glucose/arabinose dehydrogenase